MPKYPDAKFVRIMHNHVSGGESPQDTLFDVTGFARSIWDLSIETMSSFPVLEDLANYHKRPDGTHVFRCKKLLWSTESEDYVQARGAAMHYAIQYWMDGEYANPTSNSPQIRSSPTFAGPDTSVAADARRFRWLLSGHGYFMEEEGLCGHGPCDTKEQNNARRQIDQAMTEHGDAPPLEPHTLTPEQITPLIATARPHLLPILAAAINKVSADGSGNLIPMPDEAWIPEARATVIKLCQWLSTHETANDVGNYWVKHVIQILTDEADR